MRPFADDTELTRRFTQGDISAFAELVRKYQDRIYNLCRYMLQDSDDARDAAQETFLKAHSKVKEFRADSAVYSWLYRIAVNTCLDYKKKTRPDQLEDESLLSDVASADPSPERLYQSKELSDILQTALQKLPEEMRAALVLRKIEELSYEEIAEVLHISVGTVKSRISRARDDLRRLLRGKF